MMDFFIFVIRAARSVGWSVGRLWSNVQFSHSGAFCSRAPPDFTLFYFWWFCVKAGGGAQINGRAPFVRGGGGWGHITQTKPGNTPTCNKNPNSRSELFQCFFCVLCRKMKNFAGDFKNVKNLNHSCCQKYIVFKNYKYWKITSFTCEETVSVFLTISCTIIQILLWGTWCQVAEIRERGNLLLSMLTVL